MSCLGWKTERPSPLRCGFAEPLTKEPSNAILSPSLPLQKPLLTIAVGTAAGRRRRARCWPQCARHSRPGPRSLYVTTLLRAVRSCLTDFVLRCVCVCVWVWVCVCVCVCVCVRHVLKESLRRISLSQLALLASLGLWLPELSCHLCCPTSCLSPAHCSPRPTPGAPLCPTDQCLRKLRHPRPSPGPNRSKVAAKENKPPSEQEGWAERGLWATAGPCPRGRRLGDAQRPGRT